MKKVPGNFVISLGLLLLPAAIIFEDCGLPHGVKLVMMLGAVALELLGTAGMCKEKK